MLPGVSGDIWQFSYTPKKQEKPTMAMKCEICGKGPHYGNVISHANNTRRRRWNPNLKRVHALISGSRKQVRVCTACIRAGKVKKAA
jgi:large subunit ribosomal protein L28